MRDFLKDAEAQGRSITIEAKSRQVASLRLPAAEK
jgi:hypothetical protein